MLDFEPQVYYTVYIHTLPYLVMRREDCEHYYCSKVTLFVNNQYYPNRLLFRDSAYRYYYDLNDFKKNLKYNIIKGPYPNVLTTTCNTEYITFITCRKEKMIN